MKDKQLYYIIFTPDWKIPQYGWKWRSNNPIFKDGEFRCTPRFIAQVLVARENKIWKAGEDWVLRNGLVDLA